MIDGKRLLSGLMKGSFGGSGRKAVMGGSGLMMLGGVAYAAFEHFSQNRPQQPGHQPNTAPPPPPGMTGSTPPPPPPGTVPARMVPPNTAPPSMMAPPGMVTPSNTLAGQGGASPPAIPNSQDSEAENAKALLLVKAMISAAKADGEIDGDERATILKALDDQGQGGEAHAFIETEMAKPLNLFEITSQVQDEATAIEVYTASCLAIVVDTVEERQYLDRLAGRLGIEPEQAKAIEAQFSQSNQA